MTLPEIQQQLKAPKNQHNQFGNYKYRSAEDIIDAVKKLICPDGWFLNLTDEVVCVGNSNYIKATATISKMRYNSEEKKNEVLTYSAVGWAREEQTRKGMDASQITGAASSYARKYALNGLFAIDDTKDADANFGNEQVGKVEQPLNINIKDPLDEVIMDLRKVKSLDDLLVFWDLNEAYHNDPKFKEAMANRKKQLQDNKKQSNA